MQGNSFQLQVKLSLPPPAHRAGGNAVGQAVKGCTQSQLRVKSCVILVSWNPEKEAMTVV